MQWNLAILTESSAGTFVAGAGMYDPIKASRLTFFHILVAWTLGRIFFANRPSCSSKVKESDVAALGIALSRCDLLMEGQDWSVQLCPNMFFKT